MNNTSYWAMHNALQYTPPTWPNWRVESRRRCVLYTVQNSKLVGEWRVSTSLNKFWPTAKSSWVVSALWTHPSAIVTVTQFTISCSVDLLRLVTSDDIMTSLLKKIITTSIKIHVVKPRWTMESVRSVSKLSTESVDSRPVLVANCVQSHRRRDSTVASRRRCVLGLRFKFATLAHIVNIHSLFQSACLPSLPAEVWRLLERWFVFAQLDVNYETTYKTSYGDMRTVSTVPDELRHLKCTWRIISSHQQYDTIQHT